MYQTVILILNTINTCSAWAGNLIKLTILFLVILNLYTLLTQPPC